MADYAKQSQSVDLPFGNQRRSCETKPIPCGGQGRDGLATETPHGVTTNEAAVRNKANLLGDRPEAGGRRDCMGDCAKQSQFPRPGEPARQPGASGDARPTTRNKADRRSPAGGGGGAAARNKANYGPGALGLRIVDGGFRIERWESALAGYVATSRSERAKQSQFPEVGRWRRGNRCTEQSQFAGTPDEG